MILVKNAMFMHLVRTSFGGKVMDDEKVKKCMEKLVSNLELEGGQEDVLAFASAGEEKHRQNMARRVEEG